MVATRLEACRLLGWESIPAVIASSLDDEYQYLMAEQSENTCRKQFAPSELVAVGARLEVKERELARERQLTGRPSDNLSEGTKGRAREKVGAALGVSGSTYEKARTVVQAAQAEPEKYAVLVGEMDRTGSVDGANLKLQRQTKVFSEALRKPGNRSGYSSRRRQ